MTIVIVKGTLKPVLPDWYVYRWNWEKRVPGEFIGRVIATDFAHACDRAGELLNTSAANVFASKKKLHS